MQRGQTIKANADVLRHLGDSLCAQWQCYGDGLQRCRKKVSRKAVHDSRVATRRLLSTLELLKPFVSQGKLKKTCAMLKDYLDGFDELRDTQVQLVSVGKMKKQFSAAETFQQWLEKRKTRSARATRKTVRSFKARRLTRRMVALEKEIRRCHKQVKQEQARATVLRSVSQVFIRVAELRQRIKPDDTKTIHRTRVAFKHFRYMLEQLSPLLPVVTKARCEAMHDHQSKMGDIQDVEILLATFDEFLCRKKVDPVTAEKFRDQLKRRKQRLVGIYLKSADDLSNFKL